MSSQICPHCRRPYMSHMIRDFINNNCSFESTTQSTRSIDEEEFQSLFESLRQAGFDPAQFIKSIPERASRKAQIADQLTGEGPAITVFDEYGFDPSDDNVRKIHNAMANCNRVGDEAQAEDGVTRDS